MAGEAGPSLLTRVWSWVLGLFGIAVVLHLTWLLVRPVVAPLTIAAMLWLAVTWWRRRQMW